MNRQGIYKNSENEVLSLSLQECVEMEDDMRKMPKKWPMTVAARIDDTSVFFNFFFCFRKTK